MKKRALCFLLSLLVSLSLAAAEVPPNLVAEGIPPVPEDLAERVNPYLETRSASFRSGIRRNGRC